MIKQATFKITGKVQGVFYRMHAADAAEKFGLQGEIRNMPDGSVFAVFQGEEDKLQEFSEWAYKGSPNAKVTKVSMEFGDAKGKYKDIKIL